MNATDTYFPLSQ